MTNDEAGDTERDQRLRQIDEQLHARAREGLFRLDPLMQAENALRTRKLEEEKHALLSRNDADREGVMGEEGGSSRPLTSKVLAWFGVGVFLIATVYTIYVIPSGESGRIVVGALAMSSGATIFFINRRK